MICAIYIHVLLTYLLTFKQQQFGVLKLRQPATAKIYRLFHFKNIQVVQVGLLLYFVEKWTKICTKISVNKAEWVVILASCKIVEFVRENISGITDVILTSQQCNDQLNIGCFPDSEQVLQRNTEMLNSNFDNFYWPFYSIIKLYFLWVIAL